MVVLSLGLQRSHTLISSFDFKKYNIWVPNLPCLPSHASVNPDTGHLGQAPKPPAWQAVSLFLSIPKSRC